MILMAGLSVLFTLLLLDLVFKIVYASCSGVVELQTPCSLPATPRVTVPEPRPELLHNTHCQQVRSILVYF
jgi:hypothetical protein